MATIYRVEVTLKGETGFAYAVVGLDYRIRTALTLDESLAASFPTRQRAERFAAKIASRFDRVAVIPA